MAIQATPEMCYYCFNVLESHLESKQSPNPPSTIENTNALLFVTWRRGHYEDGELRGCKGCTGGAKPLPEQLRRYSLISALQDTRFDPIELQEVPKLSCHISILHSFEEVESCYDWEVGRHGVTIDFEVYDREVSSSGKKQIFDGHAIFLPNVASSNGWDHATTITQLIRKAGFKGKIESDKMIMGTTRFQASAAHCDYKSYVKHYKKK
jgi:uncharacterized protein (TIGR00296 family)